MRDYGFSPAQQDEILETLARGADVQFDPAGARGADASRPSVPLPGRRYPSHSAVAISAASDRWRTRRYPEASPPESPPGSWPEGRADRLRPSPAKSPATVAGTATEPLPPTRPPARVGGGPSSPKSPLCVRRAPSRYRAIVALPDGIKAEQVTPHLTMSLLGIPPQLRRTLTWDRGRETAEHQAITAETGGADLPLHASEPVAARHQREHQPAASAVPGQGRGPPYVQPGRPGCHHPSPMNSTICRARPMATALRQRSTLAS